MPWPTSGPLGATFRAPQLAWNPTGEDFLRAVLSLGLQDTSAGGSFDQIPSTPGHPGIFSVNSGSVATTIQTPDGAIILGGGVWSFQSLVAIPVLSNGTDRFRLRTAGVCNGPSTSLTNNEVNFRYEDDVNGGRWQAVARSGGVETAADTGVTVDIGDFDTGVAYALEVIVDAAAAVAAFYIDGGLVAQVASNVPTTAVAMLAMQTDNIAGAGGVGYIDYFKPTFIEATRR